jgi:hypothetical protein
MKTATTPLQKPSTQQPLPPPSGAGIWRTLLGLILISALLFGAWQVIGDRAAPDPVAVAGTQLTQPQGQATAQPSPTVDGPVATALINTSADESVTNPTAKPPPPTAQLVVPTDPPPATATHEPAGCKPPPSPRWVNTLWAAYEDQLGCPTNREMRPSDFAFQYYEGATAIWREDLDRIYFLYYDGTFSIHRDDEGPEGYEVSPLVKGGFGYMWNTYPELRDRLGEPLAIETNPADFAIQDFAGGLLVYFDDNGPYHFVLLNDSGTWADG